MFAGGLLTTASDLLALVGAFVNRRSIFTAVLCTEATRAQTDEGQHAVQTRQHAAGVGVAVEAEPAPGSWGLGWRVNGAQAAGRVFGTHGTSARTFGAHGSSGAMVRWLALVGVGWRNGALVDRCKCTIGRLAATTQIAIQRATR
eukprot:SAG11_NODE_785_length_7173_cov_4.452926_7_plen_145_part_00